MDRIDKIIELLDDLSGHDLDDDGDIILCDGAMWHKRIVEALSLTKKFKYLLADLAEGIDPHYCEEVLEQVGIE